MKLLCKLPNGGCASVHIAGRTAHFQHDHIMPEVYHAPWRVTSAVPLQLGVLLDGGGTRWLVVPHPLASPWTVQLPAAALPVAAIPAWSVVVAWCAAQRRVQLWQLSPPPVGAPASLAASQRRHKADGSHQASALSSPGATSPVADRDLSRRSASSLWSLPSKRARSPAASRPAADGPARLDSARSSALGLQDVLADLEAQLPAEGPSTCDTCQVGECQLLWSSPPGSVPSGPQVPVHLAVESAGDEDSLWLWLAWSGTAHGLRLHREADEPARCEQHVTQAAVSSVAMLHSELLATPGEPAGPPSWQWLAAASCTAAATAPLRVQLHVYGCSGSSCHKPASDLSAAVPPPSVLLHSGSSCVWRSGGLQVPVRSAGVVLQAAPTTITLVNIARAFGGDTCAADLTQACLAHGSCWPALRAVQACQQPTSVVCAAALAMAAAVHADMAPLPAAMVAAKWAAAAYMAAAVGDDAWYAALRLRATQLLQAAFPEAQALPQEPTSVMRVDSATIALVSAVLRRSCLDLPGSPAAALQLALFSAQDSALPSWTRATGHDSVLANSLAALRIKVVPRCTAAHGPAAPSSSSSSSSGATAQARTAWTRSGLAVPDDAAHVLPLGSTLEVQHGRVAGAVVSQTFVQPRHLYTVRGTSAHRYEEACKQDAQYLAAHVDLGIPARAVLDSAGLQAAAQLAAAVCPHDDRFEVLCNALQSSEPTTLAPLAAADAAAVEGGDAEQASRAQQQAELLQHVRLMAAAPFGRGALTCGTSAFTVASIVPVPPMTAAGVDSASGAVVNWDNESLSAAHPHLLLWPEFANGVAAGLRVGAVLLPSGPMMPLHALRIAHGSAPHRHVALVRAWLAAHSPAEPHHGHAGVVLGIGLRGGLAALSAGDLYRMLAKAHSSTTAAVLLGACASAVGTGDPLLDRAVVLHLPLALAGVRPDDAAALAREAQVQVAALASLGLLHASTGNRIYTDFLAAEIGAAPLAEPDPAQLADALIRPAFASLRGSYSLVAGWALGMICAPSPGTRTEPDSGPVLPCVQQLLVAWGSPSSHATEAVPAKQVLAGSHQPASGDDMQSCTRLAGSGLVLCPAARKGLVTALALACAGSSHPDVLAALAIPAGQADWARIRGLEALLRTAAIAVVDWAAVRPGWAWAAGAMPAAAVAAAARRVQPVWAALAKDDLPVLRKANVAAAVAQLPPAGLGTAVGGPLGMFWSTLAGAVWGMGLRFAGSYNSEARDVCLTVLAAGVAIHSASSPRQALAAMRRMAPVLLDSSSSSSAGCNTPTAGPAAVQAVLRTVCTEPGVAAAMGVPTSVLQALLSAAAYAVGMIMAGSADVVSMRSLLAAQQALPGKFAFGHCIALATAVGLLGLGGCRAQLVARRHNIGYLWLATFPSTPIGTADTFEHPMWARFFWALSTRQTVPATPAAATAAAAAGAVELPDRELDLSDSAAWHAYSEELASEMAPAQQQQPSLAHFAAIFK